MLSALAGVAVGMLIPDPVLAYGPAAALAIAGMHFLHCPHLPGDAMTLTTTLGSAGAHSRGYHLVLAPVLLNLLMLVLLAIVSDNPVGRRYPYPLAVEGAKPRTAPLGISVAWGDIHAVLLEDQFLGTDEDDVQELLENIEQQVRQHITMAIHR